MCRNIRPLFNFDPPATDDEIHAAAVQFVRKLSGFTRPSKTNEAAFDLAAQRVSQVARELIDSPRDRNAAARSRSVRGQTTRSQLASLRRAQSLERRRIAMRSPCLLGASHAL